MNIAIIGAGNVGRALSGSIVRAGHSVKISSSDVADAEAVANDTGAEAVRFNLDAAREADMVIMAVPYTALSAIVDELADFLDGKIVVDVTNRLDPEDPAKHIDGTSMAEQIRDRVSGASVVKAFNTVLAYRQANPEVDGMKADGFVAGDDGEAKEKVMQLMQSMGLRPVDSGPLSMARALEAMAVLNIALNMNNGWTWQSAWKLVGPTRPAREAAA